MEKVDLIRQYRAYYTAQPKPQIVDIAPAHFLSITGQGDPSQPAFAERVQALYATAYAIKFSSKATGQDFKVAKLEGLWWYDEAKYPSLSPTEASVEVPRSEWKYRLLLRMPDFVGKAEVAQGIKTTLAKKPALPAEGLEYYAMTEGISVQMLHVGSFSSEPNTLAQMQEFMQTTGFTKNGLHHEIYLSDFTKAAPDKLKTILREPVRPAS